MPVTYGASHHERALSFRADDAGLCAGQHEEIMGIADYNSTVFSFMKAMLFRIR